MKILASKKVTFDKVSEARSEAEEVASILDIVMDKEFIEKNRHDWCWLNSNDVPKETGWYKINREAVALEKIISDEARTLEWHERMYVYGSGHAAVKDNTPLALYIGDEYDDGRMSALYLCGPDVLTWVALKQK